MSERVQLIKITVLLSIGCIITVDAADPTFLVPIASTASRSVSEDEAPGTSILTLEGQDTDGDPLTFSVVAQVPNSPPFELESVSGLFKVPSGLDAEQAQQYNFVFGIRDGSTTTNSVSYVVNIVDVNDNVPQLDKASYNISVHASDPVDFVILTVAVTYEDVMTPNDQFIFSLSGDGSDHSTIDSTGSITVQSQLNYTNKASFNLTITVADKPTPNLSSSPTPLNMTFETGVPCESISCDNLTALAISGWVCVGILMIAGILYFMWIRMRARQKSPTTDHILYEIPNNSHSEQEHQYQSVVMNTPDPAYTNTSHSEQEHQYQSVGMNTPDPAYTNTS